jgi:hypothetical protein
MLHCGRADMSEILAGDKRRGPRSLSDDDLGAGQKIDIGSIAADSSVQGLRDLKAYFFCRRFLNDLRHLGKAGANAEPSRSFALNNSVGGAADRSIDAAAVGVCQIPSHLASRLRQGQVADRGARPVQYLAVAMFAKHAGIDVSGVDS